MATRKSGPLDAMVGTRISMLRVNRGMSQAMLAERIGVLSTDAEIRAGRQPGWSQPVVASRLRAGCFGRRTVRIFPGRISRLEFVEAG